MCERAVGVCAGVKRACEMQTGVGVSFFVSIHSQPALSLSPLSLSLSLSFLSLFCVLDVRVSALSGVFLCE